jgi:hypothetical protein
MKAKYDMILWNLQICVIKDDGRDCMSVTNDVEAVIQNLIDSHFLTNQRLFYIDSTGRCDELLYEDGKFKGFKAGYSDYTCFQQAYCNGEIV